MKKTSFFIGLALFGAVSFANANNESEALSPENTVVENNEAAAAARFAGYLEGRIGGYTAYMTVYSNGTGSVELVGSGKRTLKVKSAKGNKVIIDAYLKGKYIGYYSGTVTNFGYKGIFYNTVSGGRVSFNLEFMGDGDLL